MLTRSQHVLSRLARSPPPAGMASGIHHLPNARPCPSRTMSTSINNLSNSRLLPSRSSPSSFLSRAYPLTITRSLARKRNGQTTPRDREALEEGADALKDDAPPPPTSTSADQQPSSLRDRLPQDSSQQASPNPNSNPFAHLPDLTRGIPSTWEYEASKASQSALAVVYEQETGRGDREPPGSGYVSSAERRRKALTRWIWSSLAAILLANMVMLGRNWDEVDRERHLDIPNGWGIGLWWTRARQRLRDLRTYYQDPAFDKLLPDMPPGFERPYTLVISLEDFLVHSEWSREHGWRIAKRPGLDYFIRYLSQYYEIVVFATMPFGFGDPLVRKLDPFRFIVWPLFREATKWKDGAMVKDLSYLNRDLSKVIVLETDPSLVRNQPENAIILPEWKGDPKDEGLVAMIPFLEYLFAHNPSDVRPVLKSFEGKHIPTEFARREAIMREKSKAAKQRQARKSIDTHKIGLGSVLGSLKPKLPDGEQDPAAAFAEGKMLHDMQYERGQAAYKALDDQLRVNGEQWLKEEAERDEKMQQEALAGMKASVKSYIPFKTQTDETTGVTGLNASGDKQQHVEKDTAAAAATKKIKAA